MLSSLCRTEACGIAFYNCQGCAQPQQFFVSCGNRHCPTCQYNKAQQWLQTQIGRQLPGHHFLITFTVPEQLRSFMRQNQRACYSALFKASSEAIKKLALDQKHIGGDLPGFFGVLHTWGRTLQYHPHIHYVVSGGAIRSADRSWHPSRIDFFLPVKALSVIFQAKFRDLRSKPLCSIKFHRMSGRSPGTSTANRLAPAKLLSNILPPTSSKSPSPTRASLPSRTARCRFATANRTVNGRESLTLDVMEFIRRFLQHVLPTGFMKIRYYGFMNPNCKIALERIRGLIELSYGFALDLPVPEVEPPRQSTCPSCGGLLKLRSVLPRLKILRRSG